MHKQVNSFAQQSSRIPAGILSSSFVKCDNWRGKSGHYRCYAENAKNGKNGKRDETFYIRSKNNF